MADVPHSTFHCYMGLTFHTAISDYLWNFETDNVCKCYAIDEGTKQSNTNLNERLNFQKKIKQSWKFISNRDINV